MSEDPLTPAELGEKPASPGKRRWPIWAAIGAAIVLFLCCAGTATAGAVVWKMRHDDFTVTGDLTLSDGGTKDGAVCSGSEMYSDIVPGMQIVVSDPAGTVVAIGALGEGVSKGSDCVFPFTIAHVPKMEKFYGVTISQRGTLTYTPKQMRDGLHLYL